MELAADISGQRRESEAEQRGFGQYIVVDSSVIHDANVTLTLPWHPADSLRGARRDSAIRFELARSDHEIRRTREGFARTWRWTQAEANLGYARIADPDTVGRLVRIRKLSFTENDPPFKFRNVVGTVLNLGDSVLLDSDHFDLPGSTGKAHGSVVWGSDLPVRYYVHIIGDSVSLARRGVGVSDAADDGRRQDGARHPQRAQPAFPRLLLTEHGCEIDALATRSAT